MSVFVMSWVWRYGPKDATDRLVLLAIADHSDDDGVAYPSMAGIAQKACLTERGARGVVRRLETSGWLRTKVGGGRGGKSVYRVLMVENPEPETGKAMPGKPNPEPETGNAIPGMRNPECETRNVATENPEGDCRKPGTRLPPNHQGTIKEPSVDIKARDVREILCAVASPAAVDSFVAYRRKVKGKALTQTAATRQAAQLQKIHAAGGDPDDALGMAEERGWQSVQADWYFNARGNGNGVADHPNGGAERSRKSDQTRGYGSGTVDAFAAVAAKLQREQARG